MLVSMEKLRWIEAVPIAVATAVILQQNRASNLGGTITIPPRYEFLQRMDFFKVVGARLKEDFKRHDPTGRFVPVREVKQPSEVHQLAQEMVETLQMDDEPDAMGVLRHCIGEIVDNVFVHAASKVNAIVCAQHFPNAGRTQVAIVDTGMGFRRSFEAVEPYSTMGLTDRDAITLGLTPWVTSKPDNPGETYAAGYGRLGVGLSIISEILRLSGGRLLIASGGAMYDQAATGVSRMRDVGLWDGAIVAFETPDTPRVPFREATEMARHLATSRRPR
jgi:anti-sigma regulatory factor (Ser/Thr protein kinase)